ncbi:hypothetical protein LIER_09984 [Lithospermum erythrorhizon]|uniref:H15 domain-containing protein n=1 Tax=Lithospermum erythrorhizon TaxID=34254 RepID=A0AAV3PHQ6_LITER
MASLREAIMEHIKSKQKSLKPTQISSIEQRLTQMASQFHTPHHPPYAAMIERAVLELKQKGGSTEKSISDFIKREYDDLPWPHSSLLKRHLALLSKDGEIIQTRGFRYTLLAKRLEFAVVVRSHKANGPCQVNDQSSQVAETTVIETEKVLNDVLQPPKQDDVIGTKPLQLPDGGENDICSGSNDKNIDTPSSVITDGRDNQVGIEQLQQEDCHLTHDPCDLHALEMHELNPNEDAIHEHLSPEVPPGFEFMGVEVSDSQECSFASSVPPFATETNLLTEQIISPLPSLNKEQERNGPPIPNAEKLEKDSLPCPLQPMDKKKEVRHPEGREYDKMLEQREYVLALPHTQKGSSLSRDLPGQNKRSRRQLKRWNGNLRNISHTVKNFGKRPQVDITTDVRKSLVVKKLPSESTIITRRKAKLSSLPRQSGAQSEPVSVAICSSMDLLKKYQRRGRRPKGKTDATLLDDIQKQQAEELPKLLYYHIPKEKTLGAALSKEEFTPPNLKDHSEKEHQLEPSKPQRRGNRTVVVNKGEADQSSSTREKLKKSSHCRAKKPQKKC